MVKRKEIEQKINPANYNALYNYLTNLSSSDSQNNHILDLEAYLQTKFNLIDEKSSQETISKLNIMYRNLGEIQVVFGNKKGAIEAFKKAITLCQNDQVSFLKLGNLYLEKDNEDSLMDAFMYFKKLVELAPENAHYYFCAGKVKFKLGFIHLATEDFKKASELAPTECAYLYQLAQSQEIIGDYQQSTENETRGILLDLNVSDDYKNSIMEKIYPTPQIAPEIFTDNNEISCVKHKFSLNDHELINESSSVALSGTNQDEH